MTRIVEKNPRKLVKHGKHIFMWWNINTQQVLYSFFPGLEKSHLKQLPFIGKKSVPASLRPDFWKPFCTATFPTPYQGLIAYRKLREFRRLHETAWDETQPELLEQSKKSRIRALMRQKANSIADLAEVLRLQGEQAGWMAKNREEREVQSREWLEKKWAEVEELAEKGKTGEINKLQLEIKRLEDSLTRKTTEKEKERVTKAVRLHNHRLKKLQWALKMVYKRNALEKTLASGTTTPTETSIVAAEKAAENASTETLQTTSTSESPRSNLKNPITTSLLPRHLSAPLPVPFDLSSVTLEWADLYDAEYAKAWPEAVVHDVMGTLRRNPPVPNAERIAFPAYEEEVLAIKATEEEKLAREKEEEAEKKVEEEKGRVGRVMEKVKKIGNPFKLRALH
ncbi:hypothetical protein GQ43DRAFT_439002 [Delitschia confertaspora ATCC 74209]|uniref:Large ribosomal subunit protein mL67 n=1 Tax=Delitschia confertaspora ATCC 74209 TaxID=1513339 RepID=A0A9P4JPL8_9PLEO|nr:hypothetical protein GQ43DRAFT_439002 [Delitschia confertaspora ATCC 74209]